MRVLAIYVCSENVICYVWSSVQYDILLHLSYIISQNRLLEVPL